MPMTLEELAIIEARYSEANPEGLDDSDLSYSASARDVPALVVEVRRLQFAQAVAEVAGNYVDLAASGCSQEEEIEWYKKLTVMVESYRNGNPNS